MSSYNGSFWFLELKTWESVSSCSLSGEMGVDNLELQGCKLLLDIGHSPTKFGKLWWYIMSFQIIYNVWIKYILILTPSWLNWCSWDWCVFSFDLLIHQYTVYIIRIFCFFNKLNVLYSRARGLLETFIGILLKTPSLHLN